MQTVLLTGVNGFTGHYLVEQLVEKGFKVIGTGKGDCRLSFSHKNFIYAPLNFTDKESVEQAFQMYQPDTLIHSGAMTKPDECELNKDAAFKVNVKGTDYLLNAAASRQCHFIYVSTDFIFSGDKEIYTEDDKGNPVNYYGHTKLLAEEKVKQYPFDWSIVRTSLVYGNPKAGRQNILTNVATALKNGQVLNMYHDQRRKPTYVEDLARGIVCIAEKKANGIYHLSGEELFTPYELACMVADYLNLNKNLINPVTAETFKQPALRPPATIFDLTKAIKELDYHPIPFKEGLQRTFEGWR